MTLPLRGLTGQRANKGQARQMSPLGPTDKAPFHLARLNDKVLSFRASSGSGHAFIVGFKVEIDQTRTIQVGLVASNGGLDMADVVPSISASTPGLL